MKAVRILAVALLAGLVIGVAAAAADPPSPDNPAGRDNDILGIVPAKSQAGHGGPGGNLAYHGGPVMHTNRTYAIYWDPPGYTVSSGYRSLIDGFFQNVAADSGKTSNVYFSDTQYYDGAGSISYSSSFGGSYVDTSPLPANGCSDAYTSVCVSDSQLRAEIAKDIANAWYDRRGYENGDKCAWNFGAALGSTGYGAYNQLIGGGKYYLQQEWSNARSGCVLTGS
jgi:hypothetical protein